MGNVPNTFNRVIAHDRFLAALDPFTNQRLRCRTVRHNARDPTHYLVSLLTSTRRAHTLPAAPQLHLLNSLLKALLAVALVTLVLFFASGMYQERIAYANKYVPHANRQLRSINMFLNMRRRGRGVTGGWMRWIGWGKRGWLRFFGDTVEKIEDKGSAVPTVPANKPMANTTTSATVIPPIPPTTNPRGELIFSSRVSPQFKEGYERYRAAFERRRTEKFREERWKRSWFFVRWFLTPPNSVSGAGGTTTVGGVPALRRVGSGLSVRTEGGRSRSSSPAMVGTNPVNRSSGQTVPSSSSTPPPSQPSGPRPPIDREPSDSTERTRRDRSESYTFILGSGEVGLEGSALGLDSPRDERKRGKMGKVDEETGGI